MQFKQALTWMPGDNKCCVILCSCVISSVRSCRNTVAGSPMLQIEHLIPSQTSSLHPCFSVPSSLIVNILREKEGLITYCLCEWCQRSVGDEQEKLQLDGWSDVSYASEFVSSQVLVVSEQTLRCFHDNETTNWFQKCSAVNYLQLDRVGRTMRLH